MITQNIANELQKEAEREMDKEYLGSQLNKFKLILMKRSQSIEDSRSEIERLTRRIDDLEMIESRSFAKEDRIKIIMREKDHHFQNTYFSLIEHQKQILEKLNRSEKKTENLEKDKRHIEDFLKAHM